MKKQVLSLLLVVLMLLSLLPGVAMAASDARPDKVTLVGSSTALTIEANGYLSFYGYVDVPLYKVYVPFGTETVSLYDSGTVYTSSYGSGYCSEAGIQTGSLEYWSASSIGSSSPYTVQTRLSGYDKNLSFVKRSSYVDEPSQGYVLQFVGQGDPAPAPSITTDLSTTLVQCTYGDEISALSVIATGSGTLSYKWQVSTTSAVEGFTDIANATSASFTPPTDSVGDFWYKVIVSNNVEGMAVTIVESSVTPVKIQAPAGKNHVKITTSFGYSSSRPLSFSLTDANTQSVAISADTSTGYAVYDFWVAPGVYNYLATDTKDEVKYTVGSGTITVTDTDQLQEFEFYLVYVYTNMSGWTKEDFTTEVKNSGTNDIMVAGDAYKFASYVAYPYFLGRGSYTFKIIPSQARAAEGYQESTATAKTLSATKNNATWSTSLEQMLDATFIVSKDAIVEVETVPKPYSDGTTIDSVADTSGENTDTYTFKLTVGDKYIYRASGNGLVTNTGTFTFSANKNSFDLVTNMVGTPGYINRTGGTSGLDTADIRINGVDHTGSIALKVNDVATLTPLRMWQINNYNSVTSSSAYTFEPDFHYTVVDEYGNASDIVTVDANGTITAKREGTAIILVSYNALYVDSCGWSVNSNQLFSAIWPENTGVVVVEVGDDADNGPKTNIKINTSNSNNSTYKVSKTDLDAEMDVLYYTGNEGCTYTFTPDEGSTVTLLRPVIGESSMSYSGGFSSNGVVTDDSGIVTLTLTEGKNIVKVSKADTDSYQVITVKKARTVISNLTNPGMPIQPGDQVSITVNGVYHPANRMTYLYNFYGYVTYADPGSSSTVKGQALSNSYRYQFDSDSGNACRSITVTIPSDWDTTEPYTLTNGVLEVYGNGKNVGSHRNELSSLSTSTPQIQTSKAFTLGKLPDITIPVQATKNFTLTFDIKDNENNTISEYSITFTHANGTEITHNVTDESDNTINLSYGEWSYTIKKAGYVATRGTISINTETPDTQSVSCTLNKAMLNAWDGTSKSEPQKIDGVYQIGTGAELAWLANYVNSGNVSASSAVKAVLTADIDLAGYDWTPIGGGSANKTFYGSFDGQGYKVHNLYIDLIDTSKVGLFGYVNGSGVSGGSSIKNLTVENGSISVVDTKSKSGNYVNMENFGGIVGKADYGVTIENCFNGVDLSIDVYSILAINAGGIVGYISDEVVVKNCGNYGDITSIAAGMIGYGYGGRIGGVVGEINRTSTVTGCFNSGTIYSTGPAGGIIGYIYGRSLTFTDLYNTGDVTGGENIGGIVGYLGSNTITGAYSSTAPAPESQTDMTDRFFGIGGIAGSIGSAKITNAYYYTGTQNAVPGIGKGTPADGSDVTGKSLSELQALTSAELGSGFTTDAANINNGYPILLWQANITSIEIKQLPSKTVYTEGYSINLNGMVVEGIIDGVPTVLNNAVLSVSPTVLETIGKQIITVSYGALSDTFEVQVNEYIPPAPDTISIKTTLKDGSKQKNSRKTIDVIARDASNEKIPVDKVTVTLNGEIVSHNWDDSEKTSYTLVFTEEGENIITITALTKTVEYSIYYEKAEPGDIVGQAVFSLEAFSIGGGYIIEPCFVDIIEGENSAHMLKRVLEENGFGMTYTGTIENSFYLSAITGSALAEIDPTGDSIPQELRSKLKSIKPRTNVNRLGEFDYTSGSGWMYCINGKFPNVSFAASYLSDDDVVRVQFTIALGSDIGGGMATAIGGSSYYEIADKDELTTLMAQLGMEKVPQNVLDIATKVNATQDEADSAVAKLKEIANGYYKNDANQKTEFTDIEGHWAEEAINEVVDLGLFNGVGDNRFDPDGTMTRAMFATTIYRFANAKATGINKFSDVPNDTWYTDAVIWCNDNKIVEGTGNGFEPEENITREQIAVMFYRYAKMMQIDTTARGDINKFNDCGEISDWAKEAVEWAVGIGLLEGRTLNTLVPQGEATRAEVATIYLRLIAFMAK